MHKTFIYFINNRDFVKNLKHKVQYFEFDTVTNSEKMKSFIYSLNNEFKKYFKTITIETEDFIDRKFVEVLIDEYFNIKNRVKNEKIDFKNVSEKFNHLDKITVYIDMDDTFVRYTERE